MSSPLDGNGVDDATCERCQGNGEIVTDWERYRHPRDGDVGDEAVASCPDCDGTGALAPSHTAVEPVGELVRKLLSYCMDWNDEPMADAEDPRVMPYCGELREAASTLTAQAAALVAAEKERDAAILAASEHARARGEAEGALHVSELAGVVDGWKARAEAAEKRIAELEAGLDAAEAYNEEHGDPADTLHHGRSVLAHARRRTHQEKNNAG